MDQRKALVELLCAVECKGYDRREGGCNFRQDDRCNRINKLEMCMIEQIADHLLSNGVIVPPCKVGETVYQTDGVRIYPSTIQKVIYDTGHIAFDESAIGESILLTSEEAEKALAERSRS